jgi:Tfp pilus assembly protein PilF
MYPQARDFYRRSLSANPEDPGAWLGLGHAYRKHRMQEEAIWALEHALELEPGHGEIRQGLRRLYNQRKRGRASGSQETLDQERPKLTRGALGRLYMRHGMYDKAIDELRPAQQAGAHMPLTHVALAEALWHAGRDLEATQVCLEILEALPNCLKANLILGEVWLRGGNPRPAQTRLDVAQTLDPENQMAQKMMGGKSPLPPMEVLVSVPEADEAAPAPGATRTIQHSAADGVPVWARELEELEVRATTPDSD